MPEFRGKGYALFLFTLTILLGSIATMQEALADAIAIPEQGAVAQGRGLAVVADLDDPSTVWFNPANMTDLEGNNLTLNFTPLDVRAKYRDLQDERWDNLTTFALVPALYFTTDLGTDSFALGYGLNAPYGLASKYDSDSSFRYITMDNKLQIFHNNLAVAYKLLDSLSVAAGLDYIYSTLEMKTKLPLSLTPLGPDGTARLKADGDGFGYNVGLRWAPFPKHAVGLSYRSGIHVDYDGDVSVRNVPWPFTTLAGQQAIGLGDASADVTYPPSLVVGYRFKPIEKLKLELDLRRAWWSSVDELLVYVSPGIPGLLQSQQIPLHWNNSFGVRVGAEYQLNPRWSLRGGYFFDQSPIPDSTYFPAIPDGDFGSYCVGFGYNRERWRLDFAYTLMVMTRHNINSDQTDMVTKTQNTSGDYDTVAHLVGLSFGVKF